MAQESVTPMMKQFNEMKAKHPDAILLFQHRLHKGDKIVLTAFGAGFTWGAEYLIWSI